LAEILAREAAAVLATLRTSIPSMNTHFFRVQTQSSHGSTFYRKLQDFLQEVLYFYQKHPVEPLGRPESIMERDLKLEVC